MLKALVTTLGVVSLLGLVLAIASSRVTMGMVCVFNLGIVGAAALIQYRLR